MQPNEWISLDIKFEFRRVVTEPRNREMTRNSFSDRKSYKILGKNIYVN